jgi:hypothetical protein
LFGEEFCPDKEEILSERERRLRLRRSSAWAPKRRLRSSDFEIRTRAESGICKQGRIAERISSG